jgi:peptide/nickel transport system substrate-binding protein
MRNLRWALIAVLTAVVLVVLAACGQQVVTVVVTQEPGEATAAPTEPPKDTIIVCMAQEPDSLYGITSTMAVRAQVGHAFEARGWYYDRAFFYETQMLVNDEFPTFENGGATLENNVLTVTYTFKDNITWSDGTPFSVDDILFTRDVILDPDSGATTRGILDQMTFTKVDDHTLTVVYPEGVKDPLYFLPPLAGSNALSAPLPKHTLEGTAPADIATSDFARISSPVLGPYEVKEWVEGDHISLDAVPNWWGGEVKTPHLIYRFITDTNQLLASVLAGDCDYATSDGLQLTQLPFIQQSADKGLIKYDAIPSTVWEHIDFNTWPVEPGTENDGTPFFADARVRQAVAYGTNRQQMTEEILYGEVTPLNSYLPSDHWAYNTELDGTYPFDPDQAKQLLADAGWADGDGDGVLEAGSALTGDYSCDRGSWTVPAGTKFEVSFHTTTGNAMRQQLMSIFQSNMADIGITINLDPLPASVWFADDGPLFHRTYQIGEFAWVAGPDPSQLALYSGVNIYSWDPAKLPDLTNGPTGPFLTADQILTQSPDILSGTGITEDVFMNGRPAAEDLPDGLTLHYPEQISSERDTYEGQNNLGWCSAEETQQLFDGDNVIDSKDRLPFFLAAQKIFSDELPSLPLFQRVEVEAHVNSLCGPERGPSNYASWNIETWYFDSTGACGG